MDFLALTAAEAAFLAGLSARGVRFMVVGMSAALLQGARGVTEDVDLWFERLDHPGIAAAARDAGGFYVSANFGMRPPALGGDVLSDRFDVVTHMHGLEAFETEYADSREYVVDGVAVRVLPLARIIASKQASNRPKDQAALPALQTAAVIADDAEPE